LTRAATKNTTVLRQGDNLFKLFGTRLAESSFGYMILAACMVIPTMWLPNLKALSFLGAAGLTATVTVTLSVVYTLLSCNFEPGAVTSLANWSTLPLVFGILTFNFSGHGVFPSVQGAMKDPETFPQVRVCCYY
jgi:vesicular inhibitory amino acid transporter